MPEGHGAGLDLPGALGEVEEVDVHEEDGRGWREKAQAHSEEEDPAADEHVGAHDFEQAPRRDAQEVVLGWLGDDGRREEAAAGLGGFWELATTGAALEGADACVQERLGNARF